MAGGPSRDIRLTSEQAKENMTYVRLIVKNQEKKKPDLPIIGI